MAKFHLAHCIPNPRSHGLNGYKEVIEAIAWGLEQLGHQTTYAVNNFSNDATNIIFGGQLLPITSLEQLPKKSIFYNFEQWRGLGPKDLRPEIHFIARTFQIWDYSKANLPVWYSLGAAKVEIVPVGYAPILTRIPKAPLQDIDVLIYGLAGQERLEAFYALSQSGLSAMFVSGLYGAARDDLIARSKIILNINLYSDSKIFEIVRVSYLLANKKAVIANFDAMVQVEESIKSAVRFSKPEELIDDCFFLIENQAERAKLEEAGFLKFQKINIKDILSNIPFSQ